MKLRFNSMKLFAAFLGAVLLFMFPSSTFSVEADAAGQTALSGWQQQNGNWYFYENGIEKTGWLFNGSKWYYLGQNGVRETGWVKDNGKWYYIDPNGAMHTGWLTVNGKTYYLDNHGADVINNWKWIGSDWYFFDGSGAVVKGWRFVGGSWYYFQQPDGAMLHSNFAQGYYLQANGEISTAGNANVVSVVSSLKSKIDVGITQIALKQKLGGVYQSSTDDEGYQNWVYFLKVVSDTNYHAVNVSSDTPPTEVLGSGKADIRVTAYWDMSKKAFTINMEYFDTKHKFHDYTSTKLDYQYN